ncbi:MAG TPA: phytanoyl-CoA dioxygenase family protein [Cyclobacteriaceae bacterium]|nr:phytanoyl-CoA dioxygenase family protein [Cyclobacteriaceae bacterium]
MRYEVNGRAIEYFSEGEKQVGKPIVLSERDIDLTKNTAWHQQGYTVKEVFSSCDEYTRFQEEARKLLVNRWRDAGLIIAHHFTLEKYHEATTTQELHLSAIEQTKLLPVKEFPLGIELLEERISSIIGEQLRAHNPFDDQRIFHFRVIRPESGDNNPLHRDVWLEDYKDCINLYIPIAGSDEQSSLILVPGSHLWPDSKIEKTKHGAIINKQRFNVPAVTNIFGPFEMIRPNPQPGEVLVFSPYLIHGGAVNLNPNKTRISIEVRLWRK